MKTFFSILLILWAASDLAAHNSKIATVNLSVVEGEWVMQMSFAQAGLDVEILKEFSQEEIDQMDALELKQWFANYVRDNIEIWSNGEKITLGAGGILLGDHQTDLKFSIPEMPLFPEKMRFKLAMCEESRNQTNILRIFQGDDMTKFFLSSDNDFSADLIFEDGEISSVKSSPSTTRASALWSWSGLILIIPAILYFRKKLV